MASGIAAAFAFVFTVFSADGSGAVAQSRTPVPLKAQTTLSQAAGLSVASVSEPDNLLSAIYPAQPAAQRDSREGALPAPATGSNARSAEEGLTLAELVAGQDGAVGLSRELECLAGAVYFEAKSETLEGQLAVGRVIVNRARSGRFPASYCGVVFQRSQFSFVRGSAIPALNRASRAWKNAVAVARIADEGSWTGPAEGALFFHATRVSPNWRLTRVARIDNHVFYR